MSLRRLKIDPENRDLSIVKQCELLGVPRSSYYYLPVPETEENLLLMEEIDRTFMEFPFYGRRSMTAHFRRKGSQVNPKRILRLMRLMGLEAIYPKPKREQWERKYGKFPYLLKDLLISEVNQVWATDITYIPVRGGFLYLAAILDLHSRFVIAWELSNSLESDFCLQVAEKAFSKGSPIIFNSDQGVQYTCNAHVEFLQSKDVKISMSGKGRCWDNIFIERFWRTLKYEEVYLNSYTDGTEALSSISEFIDLYNHKRVHSSLGYKTPGEVFLAA